MDEYSLFPSLLLPALRRCWRKAVLWALIAALVLAAGGLAWGCLHMADQEARQSEQDSYALALERYNTQREALEVQIDALTVSIGKQQDYLAHSLLMNLDPYHFYEGCLSLQLHTDYQILPGMTYQDPDPTDGLRTAYTQILESPPLLQAMAEATQADVRYMAELLEAKKTESGLAVAVRFGDAALARQLLDLVANHLQAAQTAIGTDVAAHTITLTDQGVAHRLDAALATAQQTKGDKLAETVKTLTTLKNRQTDLVKPAPGIHTWKAVAKRIVLLTLAGGLLAGIAYLVVTLWIYGAGSRVLGSQQLEQLSIKSLGVYAPEYTRLDLDQRLPPEGTILLAGSCHSGQLEQLAKELTRQGRKVEFAVGITRQVQALRALQQCDGVVLAPVRFAATCAELLEQKQLIADYEKPLLGCVILTD